MALLYSEPARPCCILSCEKEYANFVQAANAKPSHHKRTRLYILYPYSMIGMITFLVKSFSLQWLLGQPQP